VNSFSFLAEVKEDAATEIKVLLISVSNKSTID